MYLVYNPFTFGESRFRDREIASGTVVVVMTLTDGDDQCLTGANLSNIADVVGFSDGRHGGLILPCNLAEGLACPDTMVAESDPFVFRQLIEAGAKIVFLPCRDMHGK